MNPNTHAPKPPRVVKTPLFPSDRETALDPDIERAVLATINATEWSSHELAETRGTLAVVWALVVDLLDARNELRGLLRALVEVQTTIAGAQTVAHTAKGDIALPMPAAATLARVSRRRVAPDAHTLARYRAVIERGVRDGPPVSRARARPKAKATIAPDPDAEYRAFRIRY